MNEPVYKPSDVIMSLANISLIMGDGYKFLLLRDSFERWEKEAKEGNKDSELLVNMVFQFERLLNAALPNKNK